MNPGRPFSFVWQLIRFVAPLAPEAALHRMIWAGLSLILTCGIGVLGYALIDDFSPFDALYQTLLTITTVGFQELHPLSREARAFTIFLMLFGVGIALYLLTQIATILLEGDLYRDVGDRRRRRMIENLSGHTVFVGAGRMGSRLASDATAAGDAIVVIEEDAEIAKRARERGWLVVEGDGEAETTLRSANVQRAARIFVVTGEDSANTVITFRVKSIAPDVRVVARCSEPDNELLMRSVGADDVLSPIDLIARMVSASRDNGG